MKNNDIFDDILLIGGGIIPEEDSKILKEQGVGEIFGPGTPLNEISKYIKNWYANKIKVYQ